MGEHHRSLRDRAAFRVRKSRILEGESGNSGTPSVRTNVRGKGRRKRSDGVSERTGDRVSESVASRFRIRRATGRDDDRIEPFRAAVGTNVEGAAGRDDFFDFRTETQIAPRKRALKHGDNVRRIVGNGEHAQVFLNFQFATARREPFHRFFRRKGSKGPLQELGSAHVSGKKFLFPLQSGRQIASSASGNGDLFSHFRISIENRNALRRNSELNERRRGHYAGGSCSNYRDTHRKIGDIKLDSTKKAGRGKKKGRLGLISCRIERIRRKTRGRQSE